MEISRAFLSNPHVDALTKALGTTCVAGMKNAVLGMDERTLDLQKEYNALVSQYQQIYGGALVELDGKQLTIPQLGPYKESLDAKTRRAAYEAEAGYFDAHRTELDELYTKASSIPRSVICPSRSRTATPSPSRAMMPGWPLPAPCTMS